MDYHLDQIKDQAVETDATEEESLFAQFINTFKTSEPAADDYQNVENQAVQVNAAGAD